MPKTNTGMNQPNERKIMQTDTNTREPNWYILKDGTAVSRHPEKSEWSWHREERTDGKLETFIHGSVRHNGHEILLGPYIVRNRTGWPDYVKLVEWGELADIIRHDLQPSLVPPPVITAEQLDRAFHVVCGNAQRFSSDPKTVFYKGAITALLALDAPLSVQWYKEALELVDDPHDCPF